MEKVCVNLVAQQQRKSRRNRAGILKQILEESANGISKTKLVSRCNLNFGSIEGYLEFLLRRNFLQTIQGGNANVLLYRTTQEGSYALDAIRIAEKIIVLKPDDQESTINRHDIAADSAPPPRTSSSKRGGG